jgi:hypothetical protein
LPPFSSDEEFEVEEDGKMHFLNDYVEPPPPPPPVAAHINNVV